LPLSLQAKLLRALEERRIRPMGSEQEIPLDVRIVAATNRPLAAEVAAGHFRDDLYYRLQVVEINLPPLRAHKEDIAELVGHFIASLAPQLGGGGRLWTFLHLPGPGTVACPAGRRRFQD
jgi:transcriptional regulator with PAS, ATPase and Fis domain